MLSNIMRMDNEEIKIAQIKFFLQIRNPKNWSSAFSFY